MPLWQIAKYQLAFAVVNFFSRNLDTLLVTKYFGISTVGFYEKTYQVMRYPLQLFTFAINPALQPVLTRYRHEPSVILSSYYQLAFKLACLGLVTAVIMFWCATDIVFILFGPQWHSAARLLQILALSIPLQMVLSSTGGVYQAMGATKQMFHCGLFSATISVTVIVLGVYLGDIEFMCIGLIVAFAINFIQCFYVLHRSVFKQFSSNDFLRLLFICMLASVNLTMLNVELSIATNYIASMQRIILVSLPTAIGGYLLYRLLQRT